MNVKEKALSERQNLKLQLCVLHEEVARKEKPTVQRRRKIKAALRAEEKRHAERNRTLWAEWSELGERLRENQSDLMAESFVLQQALHEACSALIQAAEATGKGPDEKWIWAAAREAWEMEP